MIDQSKLPKSVSEEDTGLRNDTLLRNSSMPESSSKNSLEIDSNSLFSVRFSKNSLLDTLTNFKKSTNLIPIEKFEVDLFNIAALYQVKMNGKKISIKCIQQIHHFKKIIESKTPLDPDLQELFINKVNSIILSNPQIAIEYNILLRLLDLFNGLLVKWDIASIKNYDYRYTGRALNVKLLDLNETNTRFISIDMLWISTKIFVKPLNVLASPTLIEIAHVLHDQLAKCCEVFLVLNPRIINHNYNIEKTLAFSSPSFSRYSEESLPEPNMTSFRHAELSIAKGIMKCFKGYNPRIKHSHKMLAELELAFRSFEKQFIANLLKDSEEI